ncbi:APC family permease [Alteribacillus iranensis]|uniref:Amino acid transporter n=1 Tax=Alteribacillus iranensis TaxID=930128 RepID=A0A1I2BFJ7_9BACI|nr:APC family permease [Alteribacillus iranensis]SFE54925.1 Amino acid transporter [Alteribacillus iranensis]
MSANKQVDFDKSLGTRQVMAVSFGLVVCVSTWGSALIGFAEYGVGFIVSILIAGLLYFLIAMNYSELATMYPRAASIRTYVEGEFGNRLGSMASMIYVLSFAAGVSAEVIFFGYVLNGFVPGVPWWGWAILVTTFGLIVNLIGIKNVGKLSDYLLWAIVVITLLVGIFAFTGLSIQAPDFSKLTTGFFTDGFAGLIGAFLLAMWLFAGFEVAAPLAEEVKNPGKSLPRGMFFAILAIGVLNIIFGLGAYLLVPADVLSSESGLIQIGSYIAGSVGVVVLFLFAVFCTVATVLANYSSVSRLMYGMAEKPGNMLPAKLKWLHPTFKTPWRTLITYYAVTLTLMLSLGGGGMATLVYISSFIWIVQYVIAISTNIALRKKIPDYPRPYRVPGGNIPILSIIGLVGLVVFLALSVIPPFGDIYTFYYGFGMIVVVAVYGLIMGSISEKEKSKKIAG